MGTETEADCVPAVPAALPLARAADEFALTAARFLPHPTGVGIAGTIVLFGPLSGGSVNPARQFGPATVSGRTADLRIYLSAPVRGAGVHHLVVRRLHTGRPLTCTLSGPEISPAPARRSR